MWKVIQNDFFKGGLRDCSIIIFFVRSWKSAGRERGVDDDDVFC